MGKIMKEGKQYGIGGMNISAVTVTDTTNAYGEYATNYDATKKLIIAVRATVNNQLVHGGTAVTGGGASMIYLTDRTTGASLANTNFTAILYILEL